MTSDPAPVRPVDEHPNPHVPGITVIATVAAMVGGILIVFAIASDTMFGGILFGTLGGLLLAVGLAFFALASAVRALIYEIRTQTFALLIGARDQS